MKAAKWIALAITIATGMACLVCFLVPQIIAFVFPGRAVDASSIGIIGSADGPTSVFVTDGSKPSYLMPIVFGLALLLWLYLRIKMKRQK